MILTISDAVKKYKKKETCRYFLKCTNRATTLIKSSVLGDVPACKKCADFYNRRK
jgi:hypothetical protein